MLCYVILVWCSYKYSLHLTDLMTFLNYYFFCVVEYSYIGVIACFCICNTAGPQYLLTIHQNCLLLKLGDLGVIEYTYYFLTYLTHSMIEPNSKTGEQSFWFELLRGYHSSPFPFYCRELYNYYTFLNSSIEFSISVQNCTWWVIDQRYRLYRSHQPCQCRWVMLSKNI